MTEQTIKSLAVELAGKFYEQNSRSVRFRRAFPTFAHYKSGRMVKHIGTEQVIERIPPGWMHHVVLARRMLVQMLNQPDSKVSPAMKERIAAALIEDHGKSARFGKKLAQHAEQENGKAEQRLKADIYGADTLPG